MDIHKLARILGEIERDWEKLEPNKPGLFYFMAAQLIDQGVVEGLPEGGYSHG
jgi:hypothetical protein